MSTLQDRLTRAEKHLEGLSENVASLYRSRIEFLDTNGLDLIKAQSIAGVPLATGNEKAINAVAERVRKLERRMDSVADELGDLAVNRRVEQEARAREYEAGEKEALGTLAKAQSASARRRTPEGLLERADLAVSDPVAIGEVAGYISVGQFAKAAEIVERAEAEKHKADENAAHERVEGQIKEYELLAQVSKLGEQVGALQEALTSALGRLSRLEAKPTMTTARPQTVAKAAQGRRQVTNTPDPRKTAEGLLVRADGVVDAPAVIGHISSLIQQGNLDQARRIVEGYELKHEAAVKSRARRGL